MTRLRWMALGAAATFGVAFSVAWWELGQSHAIADQVETLAVHMGDADCYICMEDCRRFCTANGIPLDRCVCDCDLECGG